MKLARRRSVEAARRAVSAALARVASARGLEVSQSELEWRSRKSARTERRASTARGRKFDATRRTRAPQAEESASRRSAMSGRAIQSVRDSRDVLYSSARPASEELKSAAMAEMRALVAAGEGLKGPLAGSFAVG